jgi:outer membrane protein assembly factor BamE (lipoprotein component of BamABCDE complex)
MKCLKNSMALMAGVALALSLSFGSASAGVTSLNEIGPKKDFPRVSRAYQDMDARFARVGTPRSVAQVRQIALGSTKKQLVGVVGQPVSAYNDGSWNFNVALPLPQRNKLICQYRVYFDDADRVAGTVWRRPQCANIVTGKGR